MSPSLAALVVRAREAVKSGSNLASALERAIDAAEAGEKFVSSVAVEPAVALAALLAALTEKRDFSNFVTIALAEYSEAHGAPTPELIEVFAKLQAAHAVNPAVIDDVQKVIVKRLRPRRATVAA